MKIIQIILTIVVVLPLTNCQSNSTIDDPTNPILNSLEEKEPEPLTEEELKYQLKQKECEHPTDYLNASFSYYKKYKHALSLKVTGLDIEFEIKNGAALATFKNMKIRVKFMAKTGAVFKEEVFDIYDYVEPGETLTYKVEMPMTNQEHKQYSTSNTEVISAECDLPIVNF